jgi:hypothetical protein
LCPAAASKAALDDALAALSPLTGEMRDWTGGASVENMPLFTPPEGAFDLTDMIGAYWRVGKAGTGYLPTIVIPGDEGADHNTLDRLAAGEAERGGCARFTKIHSNAKADTRSRACQHGPIHPTAVKAETMMAEAEAAAAVPREERKRGVATLHTESVKGASFFVRLSAAALWRHPCAAGPSRCAPPHARVCMRTLARLRRASGDCLVRYTVQKFAGASGDIRAIVRVYAVTHSHATNGTCRHLAPWCREFIRMEYIARDAPTAYEIEKAVRSEALTRGVAYAKERAEVLEPDLTEAELRRRWLNDSTQKGQFVREFFITTKMVRDMLATIERDSSELMP